MTNVQNNGKQLINKKQTLDAEGAKEKWHTIENAIIQIYKQNASSLSFQTLYTSGYLIILHKHGEILYEGVEKTLTSHIINEREKVAVLCDDSFLPELLDSWEKHRTAVSMVRDILMYMDKNYVAHYKKLSVYDLGVKIFGDVMLKSRKILERVRNLTLHIIQQERNGETAPQRMLLKNITKMMVEVSRNEVYQPCIEEYFLKVSREYYRVEAANIFAVSTTPDYIRKVFKRLEEERDRVERCLDETTKPKIENVLKEEMIANFQQQLIEKENSGCLSMLCDWKVEDLRLLYESLRLVDSLQNMVSVVKDYLLQNGLKLVTDSESNQQPFTLIDGVLELKEKYSHLLKHAFYVVEDSKRTFDPLFDSAIRKAFEDIVNKNVRFPEYLSLYVDGKLRKGKFQLREEEFDEVFDNVLLLFRHLREKDVFEKYYKIHLAKRLLGQKSSFEDAERAFITKLKTEYGHQFTSKLEGMFQDIRINQDTMNSFKQHIAMKENKLPCEITVQVLTTTYWPVSNTNNINLPVEVDASALYFSNYYLGSHNGRKLNFQYNMGNADIKMYLPNGKSFEINVSTHQMAILMMFNQHETLSFLDILQYTNILPIDLKRAMTSLSHAPKTHSQVLKRVETERASKDIIDNTLFTFNSDFKSKTFKVKLSQIIQKESEEEVKGTRTKVEEDRKWQLDAVVVRVMKSRKTMEHRMLLMEVMKLLSGRFTPTPEDIKKRIESLIEREYMERSRDSRSKYNYLA